MPLKRTNSIIIVPLKRALSLSLLLIISILLIFILLVILTLSSKLLLCCGEFNSNQGVIVQFNNISELGEKKRLKKQHENSSPKMQELKQKKI